MSWDLSLVTECPTCGRFTEQDIGNYTHNTNTMIRAASLGKEFSFPQPTIGDEVLFRAPTEGLCWGDFDGKRAGEVAEFARLIRLRLGDRKYDIYAPGNGWGGRDTLIPFLRKVESACRKAPDAIFRADG